VQSFPWTPDPLSIANCVAEAAREPSAAELLSGRSGSGRSGSLGSIGSGGVQSAPSAGDYSRLVGWNANVPSSSALVAAAPVPECVRWAGAVSGKQLYAAVKLQELADESLTAAACNEEAA
jgi:hypothetical protein